MNQSLSITKALSFLPDSYLPRLCPLCNREHVEDAVLCKSCSEIFKPTLLSFDADDRCPVCYYPLKEGTCDFCNSRNVFFETHRPLFLYSVDLHRIVRLWKFHNERYLHRFFLPALDVRLKEFASCGFTFDRVGSIHSSKAGFDVRSFVPVSDILSYCKAQGYPTGFDIKKIKAGRQATRGYEARYLEIRGSLGLIREESLKDIKSYLLIDDLFSTGATLNEAAFLLKDAGVQHVSIISLVYHGEI